MEKVREELYFCINKYGLLDNRTIAKSKQLDLIIMEEIKKNGRYKLFSR